MLRQVPFPAKRGILFPAGIALLLSVCAQAQTDITDLVGAISAQYYDSPSGEEIDKVVDNNSGTKYLSFHASGWIQLNTSGRFVIVRYSITSANDFPERDPKDWTLQGSNDGSNWTILDRRFNQFFPSRFQKKEYIFSNSTAYSYYQLTMIASLGNILQLAEWELWTEIMAHDVTIANIMAPVAQPGTAVSPQVVVKNIGANTETFPVTCRIDSASVQVYRQTRNVTGLTRGNIQTITFPDWIPAADTIYTVAAWTALTGDLLTANDTMSIVTNAHKKVYIVPYTHLDLQWGWTLQTTIDEYIPNTLRQNFSLFDKYPDYRFSFEAAYRYMLMKQYYPSDYQKLKKYIANGQWNVAGSMIEAGDVNIPSPEALIRQILHGNRFFQEEFGKTSVDILLPDCFGFPYTLPTIAAHCGLKGFSTQKFDLWGGFRPTPFSIGQWEGVDGSRITAVLKPGAYSSGWDIRENDLNALGQSTGLYAAYDYFGQGDIGGAPDESQVASLMTRIQQNNTATIEVQCASSDQIFRDLTSESRSEKPSGTKLPTYKGELLMTTHGTGCYTAHADMKLLNRSNELMANGAERASVLAELFAGAPYPRDQLKQNWILFLLHDFHDDVTGTSIQAAYDNFSLPDLKNALASFAQMRNDANDAIAAKLDTRVDDQNTTVPVVVYNPVAAIRNDIVEATVAFPGSTPVAARVYDKDGIEVPSQVKESSGQNVRILFMADVPAVGYSVYQIKKTAAPCSLATGLQVSTGMLENKRYRVTIDGNGDVSSIFDKLANRELLSGPSRFEIRNDRSSNWPAWEVLYNDVVSTPRSYVDQSVQKVVVDSGAAQVTLRVTRSKEGSSYTHDYSLTADTAGYFKVENVVDWKENNSNGSLLKVSFPLTISNPNTTYDLGLGTIDRGVNKPELYEVPGQQWADITNPGKSYGVAVLNNCKYGWDKPADNKIQLTLIHTPNSRNWYYSGDRYVHNFTYAIHGHPGDWADGKVVWAAERLNQPLVSFQATAHDGALGKSFSFITLDPAQIAVLAVKKAEAGNDYVVRVREVAGKNWLNVPLTFNAEIVTTQEVNGMEEQKGGVSHTDNTISFDIGPYQLKTFALQLKNLFGTTGVAGHAAKPATFALLPLYPNPANPEVSISFDLPNNETVRIVIYNQAGQVVRTLMKDVHLPAGRHTYRWDQSDDKNQPVSSGVYFVRLQTTKNVATQRVVVLK